jgi:hypothetical protein
VAGELFSLEDDSGILRINSPKDSVGGPYSVVYKDLKERWAIVAMDWEEVPSLGIRWFWGSSGNPVSSGYPTWLIIPSGLNHAVLGGRPLPYVFRKAVENYLAGSISGVDLSKSRE